MLTEPTTARKARARSLVPSWARLLWLGALLFGLLYAHGLHADSSAGHTAPGTVAAAPADHQHEHPSGDEHDTDGESAHSVPDCATGQPASDFCIAPPAVSPLDYEHGLHDKAGIGHPAVAAPPAGDACPASVVLRI